MRYFSSFFLFIPFFSASAFAQKEKIKPKIKTVKVMVYDHRFQTNGEVKPYLSRYEHRDTAGRSDTTLQYREDGTMVTKTTVEKEKNTRCSVETDYWGDATHHILEESCFDPTLNKNFYTRINDHGDSLYYCESTSENKNTCYESYARDVPNKYIIYYIFKSDNKGFEAYEYHYDLNKKFKTLYIHLHNKKNRSYEEICRDSTGKISVHNIRTEDRKGNVISEIDSDKVNGIVNVKNKYTQHIQEAPRYGGERKDCYYEYKRDGSRTCTCYGTKAETYYFGPIKSISNWNWKSSKRKPPPIWVRENINTRSVDHYDKHGNHYLTEEFESFRKTKKILDTDTMNVEITYMRDGDTAEYKEYHHHDLRSTYTYEFEKSYPYRMDSWDDEMDNDVIPTFYSRDARGCIILNADTTVDALLNLKFENILLPLFDLNSVCAKNKELKNDIYYPEYDLTYYTKPEPVYKHVTVTKFIYTFY